MKVLKSLFGLNRRKPDVDSGHRVIDGRHRPLPGILSNEEPQEEQALEAFLAENKKRMAEAEANAPAAPQSSSVPAPEETPRQEPEGGLAPRSEAAPPKGGSYATSAEGMAASKANSAERAGASQYHSTAQAAARAEDSMKRNAARSSKPSAGRSL